MKNLQDMKIRFERLLENIRKKREAEKRVQCKIAECCEKEVNYYDLPDIRYEEELGE